MTKKAPRFLGSAQDARKIADDFIAKGEVQFPTRKAQSLLDIKRKYADVLQLVALRRMERLLDSDSTKPDDLVKLLKATVEFSHAAREEKEARRKPQNGKKPKTKKGAKGGGKKEEDDTAAPVAEPATAAPPAEPSKAEPAKPPDLEKLDDVFGS